MKQGEFVIRDVRKRGSYSLDDDYLDDFAKICGSYATCVYNSLARHTNFKTQTCFPSVELMAEQHDISEFSVKKGLKKLERHNIIARSRDRDEKGRLKRNEYVLLDKSQWSKSELPLPGPAKSKAQGCQATLGIQGCHTTSSRVATQPLMYTHNKVTNNTHENTSYSHEAKLSVSRGRSGGSKSEKPNPDVATFLKFWGQMWSEKVGNGEKYLCSFGKEGAIVKKLLRLYPLARLQELAYKFFESGDQFIVSSGYTIGVFSSCLPRLVARKESFVEKFVKEDEHASASIG